jgi:PAS domain S-box-containing protein
MEVKKNLKQLRFQRMLEEIEDYAILLLDRDGFIENWNKGAEKIKGYTAKEAIGQSFHIFYTPEDRKNQMPDKLIEQAAREGKAHQESWRIRKDGERFWGSITITAIHDNDGEVIGFTKVTRDLTEEKLTKERLRRSEDRFANMISEIQDYAILLMDTNGNIENWNKGAERIKGYKANEIIGKNFRLFYTPEDLAAGKPDSLLEKARKYGRAQDESWRVRKDGTLFWGSVTITALHNDLDEVIGFSKVTRDMTDLKKAQTSLLNVQKMEARNDELEQLTYITSHDLQEPLRNISSLIDMLAQDYATRLDETGRQTIRYISESAARMRKLIHGLLDYGRLGRNADAQKLDCNKIIQDVLADFHVLIRETGATFHIGNLPHITGYETEFRLLLQNLVGNALKFRQPDTPPEITIWAEQHHGNWKFAVKDNGIGIDWRYQDRIFLIFQRLHKRQDYDGSGIGLAHCKRIVELHNGQIWVDSQPGIGSTFYFTINM